MTLTSGITTDALVVQAAVLSSQHQAEVRQSVVGLVSVNVMNKLVPKQRALEFSPHEPTVESYTLPFDVYTHVSSWLDVSGSWWSVNIVEPAKRVQSVVTRTAVPSRKEWSATGDTLHRRLCSEVLRTQPTVLARSLTYDARRSGGHLCAVRTSSATQWITPPPPSLVVGIAPTPPRRRSTTNCAHAKRVTSEPVPVNLDAMR